MSGMWFDEISQLELKPTFSSELKPLIGPLLQIKHRHPVAKQTME